jgi:hypothetical protein
MKYKIYDFIDNEEKYIPILSNEIIDIFKTQANKDNVEYNFVIDGSNKKLKGEDANTSFVFDTNGQTSLHDFKKALFEDDLKNIKEESEEEETLMEDVRTFLLKVCKEMTDKYNEEIKKVIYKVVLGNKHGKDKVPLNTIQVVTIDIADYSSIPESYKYILRIGKKPETEIDVDEIIKFVQDREESTGMRIKDILTIEQKSGNPMFENVVSIEPTNKFLNEISIYFFVDYSVKN